MGDAFRSCCNQSAQASLVLQPVNKVYDNVENVSIWRLCTIYNVYAHARLPEFSSSLNK